MALFLGAASSTAYAQFSKSIALSSDYWYRGISLSRGGPVLQATIDYDFPDGEFTGLFTSEVRDPGADRVNEWMFFTGKSFRLKSFGSIDIGFQKSWLNNQSHLHFTEFFAGLTSDRDTLRFYYSPRYLGDNSRSVYADFSTSYAVNSSWSMIFHAGLLTAFTALDKTKLKRYDARFGVAKDIGLWNFQMLFNAVKSIEPLSVAAANKVSASITYSF